jgi:hypothetical protein
MVAKMKSYVPPGKRAATKAEAKEITVNLTDEKEFPTMGAVVHKKWEGKSFKQKIEDLIALDKRSAAERKAAKDAEEARLGWRVLTLPKTRGDFEKIHDRIIECNNEIKRIQELKDLGLYIEPIDYVNLKTLYTFEDDYSDSELVSED